MNEKLRDALAIHEKDKLIRNENDLDILCERTVLIMDFKEKHKCRYQDVLVDAARRTAEIEATLDMVLADRDALKAENENLRKALEEIAFSGTSQPPAMNMPEVDWYKGIAFGFIIKAAKALKGGAE